MGILISIFVKVCIVRVQSRRIMENFMEGKIEEQKLQDGHLFPKVLFPANHSQSKSITAVLESITSEDNKLWIQRELHECGAILFRGFAIRSADDFNRFVEAFGWQEEPYRGFAPRNNIVGRVWSANEAPLHQQILFHHEMMMYKEIPSKIFFFCDVAPPEGGETAVVLSHRVAACMEHKFPGLLEELDTKGIINPNLLPKEDNLGSFIGKSWQSFFQTKDPEKVRRRVEDEGWKLQWMEDGSARIVRGPFPGTRTFEGYGDRKVWFNYIAFAKSNKGIVYGDGPPIPNTVTEELGRVMDEESVDVKWEAGDVLLLDNLAVMHGRRPSKPPRRVLVALCK